MSNLIPKGYSKDILHINCLLSAIMLFAVLRYQFNLLFFREWMDESETIVVTKMIANNYILYKDVFSQHGPLSFLPGVLISSLDDFRVPVYRLFILCFELIAINCIRRSVVFKSTSVANFYAFFSAAFYLIFLPKFYSHTYIYQNIAGILLVIILTTYSFPAILSPERLCKRHVFVGNFLLACLPFLGIIYLPVSILLFAASYKGNLYSRLSLGGLIVGLIFNIAFLSLIGSFLGLYVFHIYFNANIMPLFSDPLIYSNSITQLALNAIRSTTKNLAGFMFLIAIIFFFINLVCKEKFFRFRSLRKYRSILLFLALMSLLVRGSVGTYSLPFYYFASCVPIFLIFDNKIISKFYYLILIPSFLFCILKFFIFFDMDQKKFSEEKIPARTEFSEIVKRITTKDDRIISYTFQNFEYIVSERLPASGYFTYMPWQVEYSKNPIYGININACNDLQTNKPKIMFIDKLLMWGKFPWSSYGECIQQILDEDYIQIKNRPYYVRKDIYGAYKNYLQY